MLCKILKRAKRSLISVPFPSGYGIWKRDLEGILRSALPVQNKMRESNDSLILLVREMSLVKKTINNRF